MWPPMWSETGIQWEIPEAVAGPVVRELDLPSSRTSMMATVGSPAAAAFCARRILERDAAVTRSRVPIVAISGWGGVGWLQGQVACSSTASLFVGPFSSRRVLWGRGLEPGLED